MAACVATFGFKAQVRISFSQPVVLAGWNNARHDFLDEERDLCDHRVQIRKVRASRGFESRIGGNSRGETR